ncbi:MAG: VCBS repeat-containing protein, partial [Bacteroidetes bacterium]|nr:VCBS repeat-containing protein [Bacteroidota bacterium]
YDYKINYEYSPNSFRSRITSIQECNGNGVCFKPTTFQWQTNEEGWEENKNYIPPQPITWKGKLQGFYLVDLNGNGLSDIIQNDANPSHMSAWINNGTTWVEDKSYMPPAPTTYNGKEQGFSLVDLNGDGLLDIIQNDLNPSHMSAWINNGKTWIEDKSYLPPNPITYNGYQQGFQLVDLNGDGLLDIIQNDGRAVQSAWLNNGTTWIENISYQPPKPINKLGKDTGFRLVDLNGDGLLDIIQNDNDGVRSAWINNGTTWVEKKSFTPKEPITWDGQLQGFQLIDLNGDGLEDIIQNDGNPLHMSAWINNGVTWIEDKSYMPPAPITYNGEEQGFKLVDLNGDGLLDIIQNDGNPLHMSAWINNGTTWVEHKLYMPPERITYNGQDQGFRLVDLNGNGISDIIFKNVEDKPDAWLNKAKKLPDYLIGVTDGLGEKTSIDYEPLSGTYVKVYDQEKNADGTLDSQYPNPQFDGPMYVVYQTASDTGLNDPQTKLKYQSGNGQVKTFPQSPYSTLAKNDDGSQHITTYHYVGSRMNKLGEGFLGFHKVQTTDNTTGITTTVTYSQDPSQHTISQPLSTITQQANGNLLSDTENTWDLKTFGDGSVNNTYYLPYTKQNVKKTYDLNNHLLSTVTTDTTMDDYANPTEMKVTTQDNTGNYVVDTKNTYTNNTDKWFIGELTDTTVTRSAPNTPDISRNSHFDYDANTGMLMKTVVEPNDSNFTVNTQYTRDQFGNITST